jgi:putative oxidoreductase
MRYYFPVFGTVYRSLDGYMLPLLRIAVGLILIPHGCQKLFGWFGGTGYARMAQIFESTGFKPGALWLAPVVFTELVCGLLLVPGLFTRFAALALTIFMLTAVWSLSLRKGFFWTAGGSEYSLLLLAAALIFLIKGGGEFSLDRKIGKEV